MKKIFLLILGFSLMSSRAFAGAQDVNIDISRFESRKVNIAIADFQNNVAGMDEDWGAQAAAIIKNDLVLSGYFNIIENGNDRALQADNLDFAELSGQGIDAIAKGSIAIQDDKILLDCYLYDTASKARVAGIRYKASLSIFRKSIHNFSDEIIYRYTGSAGIAHSRICFVGDLKGLREVYAVDYDGYNFQAITREKSLVILPRWSPDGGRIIYTSYRDGNPDLYCISSDGSGRRMICGYQGLNTTGRYSPDGKYIAVTLSKDGNPDLYLLNGNGELLRRLTNSRSIDSSPSWSPGSQDIVFVSDRSGTPQLYVIDIEGLNLRRLTYTNGYNDSPDWSPTGDRIAYVARMQNEFNIFTTDVNGSYQQQLTKGSGRNENPSWSPDGRFIVFISNRNGKSQLYVMNNDGSNQRPLFPGELSDQFKGEIYTPDWSR